MIGMLIEEPSRSSVSDVWGLPWGRPSGTLGGMYASQEPGIQAPLSGAEAALIGLAALGVVMIPFLWPLADHLDIVYALTWLLLLSGARNAVAHGARAGDAGTVPGRLPANGARMLTRQRKTRNLSRCPEPGHQLPPECPLSQVRR
jgi:hypothetical protein